MSFSLNGSESLIAGVAAVTMLFSQMLYIKDVFYKKITPSILSWFGWAFLMGVSMLSQIIEGGLQYNQLGILASVAGCSMIGAVGLMRKNYSINKIDWYILLAGLFCLVLYLFSKNPWSTTIYAIIADFIIAIPTLNKVIRNPQSEKTNGWYLSLITWGLTLLISFNGDTLYALFPVYLFSFSVSMCVLMNLPKRRKKVFNT